uniref:Uncharacterized protein n=1 Tax=Triticum urartu TaxID=4572 RepID=A0A8R7K0F5_TRIUA
MKIWAIFSLAESKSPSPNAESFPDLGRAQLRPAKLLCHRGRHFSSLPLTPIPPPARVSPLMSPPPPVRSRATRVPPLL